MFDSEALTAWGSHVDGAAALLRVRGKELLTTELQCKMFLFIRRSAVRNPLLAERPSNTVIGSQ